MQNLTYTAKSKCEIFFRYEKLSGYLRDSISTEIEAALNNVPLKGPGTEFAHTSVHSDQSKQGGVFAFDTLLRKERL